MLIYFDLSNKTLKSLLKCRVALDKVWLLEIKATKYFNNNKIIMLEVFDDGENIIIDRGCSWNINITKLAKTFNRN
jgi:hypothetical protein